MADKNPNSIDFGLIEGPLVRVIALAQKAFRDVATVNAGSEYMLGRWDADGHTLVGVFQGPTAEGLPPIRQSPSTFDEVTFTLHTATNQGTAVEILLILRSCPKGVYVDLTFSSNIMESLGASWVVRLVDTMLPRLGVEAGMLCDRRDEAAIAQRSMAGERLSGIALARVTGGDPLPPPLLTLVRSDLCDDAALAAARERGVSVHLSLRGNLVFSTVDL